MKTLLLRFIHSYFSASLDLRVRLFNILAFGGTMVSLLMVIVSLVSAEYVTAGVNLVIAVLSAGLLIYSRRSGRYQTCYVITITAIFLLLFSLLFFQSGGYHGGMPIYFVFAITFTVFMLEGKKAVIFSAAELVIYLSLCLTQHYFPQTVNNFATETDMMIDILVSFTVVSIVLGVCLYLHFRLYNEQQKKLAEQNEQLEQIGRMKTEFISNTSHEMRTPLTVISVDVQRAMEMLSDLESSDMGKETRDILQKAHNEVMRLARLVNGMLRLASMRENVSQKKTDFSALLLACAENFRPLLGKHGNALQLDIADSLPNVFCDADLIAQVIADILQNANTHTQNGVITMRAEHNGQTIQTTITDTGCGIDPALLPRIFERGVSDGKSTGYGLYLCKTILESHGGSITVESQPGKGTSVTFTMPVYAGQLGGEMA